MVLGYWKIRGIAAGMRQQLVYCGVEFENKMYEVGDAPEYSRDVWFNEKPKLGMDFPNLPYFMDGSFKMTESLPIHEYIADKWCPALKGKTPQMRAKVNMLAAIVGELKMGVTMPCYSGDKDKLMDAISSKLPGILKFKGDNKFLVGNDVTYVDFYFFELVNLMAYVKQDLFSEYSALEAYVKSMHSLPKLGAYLADPNCVDKNLPFNNKMAKIGGSL